MTVVDGRRRLGMPPGAVDDSARIVLLRHGEETVGLLVDRVLQVEKLAPENIKEPPATLSESVQRGVQGVSECAEGSLLIVLDRRRFLDLAEVS